MLHLEDSYVQEFDAVVTSVKDGKFVTLDKTYFYPRGGGQPCDEGTLTAESGAIYKVIFVGKFGGVISHEVSTEGLAKGSNVRARIDWHRRYMLMRTHTASHILSAVMHDDYGAKITGNQLSTDKFRVDFSLEQFDRTIIDDAILKANKYIQQNLPVTTENMNRVQALQNPGLVKLAGAMPPEIETLRIVTIGSCDCPVDRQADGGTHVKNTSEIGSLELIKADNKGKSNRRVYVQIVNK